MYTDAEVYTAIPRRNSRVQKHSFELVNWFLQLPH